MIKTQLLCTFSTKKDIENNLDFIKKHSDHYVLTDGVNAGDKNYEKFYMIDIIKTPQLFNKKHKRSN